MQPKPDKPEPDSLRAVRPVTKWTGTGKALTVWIIGVVAAHWTMAQIADYLDPFGPNSPGYSTFASAGNKKLAVGIAAYFLFLVGSRFVENGAYVLYEMLWGCNIAINFAIFGLWTNRPLMLGAACVVVSGDQFSWYIDIVGYILFRKFPIGVAKFLTWPQTKFSKKLSTTHHVFFMPLCFYALAGAGGVRVGSHILSGLLSGLLVLYCRLTIPKTVPHPDLPKPAYLNVNAAYEMWPDLKLPHLHWCNNSPAPIYIAWLWFNGNVVINYPFYLIMRGLSLLLGL